MRNLVYAGLAVLIASAAFAAAPDALTAGAGTPASTDAVGSIISSFMMSGTSTPYALGIYRDASYVYGIFYSPSHIRRYTTAGSIVSTHAFSGLTVNRGADHAHLGSGYLSIADNSGRKVGIFRLTGGAPITTFTVSGVNMNVAFDGTYYYSNAYTNRGLFYRYTTSGSSAGTWSATGWPGAMASCGGVAYVDKFMGGSGGYFVACSWTSGQPSAGFTKAGSLVRSFTLPPANSNGTVGGPSSGAFGEVYWVNRYSGSALQAMEVDLGNTTSVTPTSLGKVKSLFR
jgi:hypothetical protein